MRVHAIYQIDFTGENGANRGEEFSNEMGAVFNPKTEVNHEGHKEHEA